jgi:hypothetical protein
LKRENKLPYPWNLYHMYSEKILSGPAAKITLYNQGLSYCRPVLKEGYAKTVQKTKRPRTATSPMTKRCEVAV